MSRAYLAALAALALAVGAAEYAISTRADAQSRVVAPVLRAMEDGSYAQTVTYNGMLYRVSVCLPFAPYGNGVATAPCRFGGGPNVRFSYVR